MPNMTKLLSSTIIKWLMFIFLLVAIYMVYTQNIQQKTDRFINPEEDIKKEIDNMLEEIQEQENVVVELSAQEHYGLAQLYHHGKFGKERDIIKARAHYEKAIANSHGTDHKLIGECHLRIAELFEDYAEERSGFHMINHYLEALKHGYEESIIHIGRLYTNGLHPYILPDKMMALRLFSTYKNSSEHIRRWCRVQMREVSKHIHYRDVDALSKNGIQHKPLPQDIIDRMLDITNRYPIRFPYHSTAMDKTKFQELLKEELREKDEDKKKSPQSVLLRIPAQTVRNDSQNVHDHSLQNIGNTIITKLEDAQTADTSDFNLNRASLYSLVDDAKFPNIRRVVHSLMGDVKHSRFDKTEQEVFNLVWNRVKDNQDMTDMFMDNLNSCVENEHVVCSTGKIMRMLSTLDVVDDETPDLKPEWVVRQEIMSTIANVIKKLSPSEKRAYESDNNQGIRDKLHTRIRNICAKAYKDVLQPDILENYMNEYLEYV